MKETPKIVKECPLWLSRFERQEKLTPADWDKWINQDMSSIPLPNGWDTCEMWHYGVGARESVPGIATEIDLSKMKIR